MFVQSGTGTTEKAYKVEDFIMYLWTIFFLLEFFYHVLLDLREICLSDFESLCWTFKHESILLSKQTEQINEKEKPFTQYTHLVSTHKNIKISKTKPKQCRVAGGLSRKEKKIGPKKWDGQSHFCNRLDGELLLIAPGKTGKSLSFCLETSYTYHPHEWIGLQTECTSSRRSWQCKLRSEFHEAA